MDTHLHIHSSQTHTPTGYLCYWQLATTVSRFCSFERRDDEPIMRTCHRKMDRYTHTALTHTNAHAHTHALILHPSEHQRVLFCDPLEFSFLSLLLPPAFDLNQRGCDLTVMNAVTYHTAQSECMYVYVILKIPVINKALFDCEKVAR